MRLLLIGCLIGSLLIQAVGARVVFAKGAGFSFRTWIVAAWFSIAALGHLWICASSEVNVVGAVVACLMHFASWWLFVSAGRANAQRVLTVAYSEDAPEVLLQDGPYRFVRHPFYTSYLLAWAAGFVATQSFVLLAFVCGSAAVYVHAARFEEGKFMASGLADAYAAYRARVGMFLPVRLG